MNGVFVEGSDVVARAHAFLGFVGVEASHFAFEGGVGVVKSCFLCVVVKSCLLCIGVAAVKNSLFMHTHIAKNAREGRWRHQMRYTILRLHVDANHAGMIGEEGDGEDQLRARDSNPTSKTGTRNTQEQLLLEGGGYRQGRELGTQGSNALRQLLHGSDR